MRELPADLPPYVPGSETSREAAESVADDVAALRAIVFELFQREGEAGLTDDEIAATLELDGNTARPRRWELAQDGVIRDSGRKRKTRRGRNATVWVLVPPPRTQLELLR